MRKRSLEQAEELVLGFCGMLSHPLRAKIVLELKRRRELSYAEIVRYCHSQIDQNLNEGLIHQNLELLKEKGMIVIEKKLQIHTPTGKPRYSFYKLTKEGKMAANFFGRLLRAMSAKKGVSAKRFALFLFLE